MATLRRFSLIITTIKPATSRAFSTTLFRADREKADYADTAKRPSDDFAEEADFRFWGQEVKNPTSQYRSDLLDDMKHAVGEPGELPGNSKEKKEQPKQ